MQIIFIIIKILINIQISIDVVFIFIDKFTDFLRLQILKKFIINCSIHAILSQKDS